jgi:hypothetical protein
MSAVATAGAAAWVVPEILTAKPAAGATLSGNHTTSGGGSTTPGSTGGSNGGTGSNPATNPAATGELAATKPATTPGSTLAFTGIDIQRDAEIGAALIAGGWAMHHWASRAPKPATAEVHEAGSPDDRI